MAYEAVDGMLTIAKLKFGLFGAAIYTDVAIRRDDGDVRRLGTILVRSPMKRAMVPGSRGRFYVYNVIGTKGIYGFRAPGRPARCAFPRRFELMLFALSLLNLLLAIFFVTTGSGLAWISCFMTLLTLGCGALFLGTRLAAVRAFRADEARLPSSADLRAARVGA